MIENVSTQLTMFHCLCPLPASRKGLRLPLRSALFGEGGRDWRPCYEERFCEIIWISGPGAVVKKIFLTYTSGLRHPSCSAEQNHLCNFGKGHYEELFCEIILNKELWFRRRCLKYFLSTALAALLFAQALPFWHFW